MKAIPLNFGSDNPEFNSSAALDTYNWYMNTDKGEADFILNSVMSAVVSKCMEDSGDSINEMIAKSVESRVATLKQTLKKGIINKSMSDETVDAVVEAVESISKANEYTSWERARNVQNQRRGAGGRFTSMGKTKLNNSQSAQASENHPSFGRGDTQGRNLTLASRHGLRNLGQYQSGYDEITEALRHFAPSGEAPITAEVTNNSGKTRKVTVTSQDQADEIIRPTDFAGNNEVQSIEWFAEGNESLQSAGYVDPVAAAGSGLINYQDRKISNGVTPGESGTTRSMRHISNVSETANEMGLGHVGGTKAKVAIAAGKMIGDLGPEAEKALGPTVRRAAYRYRGTERDVDPAMLRAISHSIAGSSNRSAAREEMMIPRIETEQQFGGKVEVANPSPFLNYWKGRLPDVDLVDLQTNSGSIAPSEGVIFNRAGQPVSQAVGYGDDHYLPFNLRKIGKVKGGEYVRTRTLGGHTSEDIYAGIMSGTRSATVVSHSGIFTIEFDKSFRGARRLNDKAGKMKGRYEKLLDSLNAEQVHIDQVPPDRKAELRKQAKAEIPGDTASATADRRARVQELEEAERSSPTPAKALRDEWAEEFVLNKSQAFTDNEGNPLGIERLKAEMSMKVGARLDTTEDLIRAIGKDEDYAAFTEKKEREYASDLRPLRLNGQGYFKALTALKEQFPYYIENVRWTQPENSEKTANKRDKGYVKSKNLRSDSIQEGFFDPEIEGYVNSRGTGKRSAGRENYANFANKARLGVERDARDAWETRDAARRVDDDEDGPPDPPMGDGGLAAPGVTPSSAANRNFRTPTGITVDSGSAGSNYTGFSAMQNPPPSMNLTDFQQGQQVIKVRKAISGLGNITYRSDGVQHQFNPWSANSANPLNQDYAALMSKISDDEFIDRLSTDEAFRTQALSDVNRLYQTGNAATEGGEAAIMRSLAGNAAFNGIVDGVGQPKNPRSAAALVNFIGSKSSTQYDFTSGRLDGSNYLPGLSDVEYKAIWNADADVKAWNDSSLERFGYKLGLETKDNVFNGVLRDFSKSLSKGIDMAQQWRSQIASQGGARSLANKTVIDYGGKKYSAHSVDDLERVISRDALALAKMKQIKNNYTGTADDDIIQSKTEPKSVTISPDPTNDKVQTKEELERVKGDLRFSKKPNKGNGPVTFNTPPSARTKLKESRARLEAMEGLGSVKDEFDALINEAEVNRKRRVAGLKVQPSTMHLVFSGSPGTGKTEVAKEIANSYNALGLIPKDTFVPVTRSDLVAPYSGQTAAKVAEVFRKAKGGVLFIDEAYALKNGKDDAFGQEAIDELVSQTENNRDDTVVILAGYSKEMRKLMGANSGLRSRYPKTIDFPDYSKTELASIGDIFAERTGYVPDDKAKQAMKTVSAMIASSPNYSNARDMRNFNDVLRRTHSARMARIGDSVDTEDLKTITREDVKNASKLYFKQRTGNVSKRLIGV
jgi:DNA polymerase III delta prime subunit